MNDPVYSIHAAGDGRIRLSAESPVLHVCIRVRTIVQKSDSPIVDSIGQNNRPMRWRCDSFSASITVKQ